MAAKKKRSRQREAAATPVEPASETTENESPLDLIGVALLLTFVFLLGCTNDYQSDTGWHLKTGQLIWSGMEVPATDWFTYPSADARWIDLHWGWQVIAFLIAEQAGVAGLIVLKCVLGAATFLFCLASAWPGIRGRILWLLPAILLFSQRYVVRPEMLSLLFAAVTLAIWARAKERPKVLWLLIPVHLLWVNSHAIFAVGLVISSCYIAELLVAEWFKWTSRFLPSSPAPLGPALTAYSGSILACFINPYGGSGFTFPLTLYTRIHPGETKLFFQQLCGEFRGMNELLTSGGGAILANTESLFLLLLYAALAASFIIVYRTTKKLALARLLLSLGFGYLAWQSWRNGALFSVVAAAIIAQNIADARAQSGATWFGRAPAFRWTSVALLVGICISVPTNLFAHFTHPYSPRLFGLDEKPFIYAHEAAKYLGRDGMPERVYATHFGHASTYILHNGPNRKVFADGRLELNKIERLKDYLDIQLLLIKQDPKAETLLRAGDPQVELPALMLDVEYFAPFPELLSHPRWRPVFSDGIAIVFLPEEKAEAIGAAAVDRASLTKYLSLVRQAGSVGRLQQLRDQLQTR